MWEPDFDNFAAGTYRISNDDLEGVGNDEADERALSTMA
jgi:hypothetical protein